MKLRFQAQNTKFRERSYQSNSAKSLQSCPTLCDPVDGSPPGSCIHGILQARVLEWVAIAFSNALKWEVKVKSTQLPCFISKSSKHYGKNLNGGVRHTCILIPAQLFTLGVCWTGYFSESLFFSVKCGPWDLPCWIMVRIKIPCVDKKYLAQCPGGNWQRGLLYIAYLGIWNLNFAILVDPRCNYGNIWFFLKVQNSLHTWAWTRFIVFRCSNSDYTFI